MNSDVTGFADEVLGKFAKQITGEVFLMIQNDRELMHKYLRLLEHNKLDTVNQWIGRRVKERFGLENEDGDDAREEEPLSTLIQSHQKFK